MNETSPGFPRPATTTASVHHLPERRAQYVAYAAGAALRKPRDQAARELVGLAIFVAVSEDQRALDAFLDETVDRIIDLQRRRRRSLRFGFETELAINAEREARLTPFDHWREQQRRAA